MTHGLQSIVRGDANGIGHPASTWARRWTSMDTTTRGNAAWIRCSCKVVVAWVYPLPDEALGSRRAAGETSFGRASQGDRRVQSIGWMTVYKIASRLIATVVHAASDSANVHHDCSG
jgi:hypothetical protein